MHLLPNIISTLLKKSILPVILIWSLISNSQNQKNITIDRAIDVIKLSGQASVTIIENNQPIINMSGTFNDYTESNGVLEFRGKCTVTISCSPGQIKSINGKDKSELKMYSFVKYDSLSFNLEDYARANISMHLNKVIVTSKDYSEFVFSGHADFVDVQSFDFTQVDISSSDRANYQLSDFATLKLCALSEVNGKSEDFAKVTLSGNPLKVNIETNDFSKISRKKDGCKALLNPAKNLTFGDLYLNNREEIEDDDEKSIPKKSIKKRYSWQGVSAGINAIMNENHSFGFDKKYDFFEPNYSSSFNFQLNPFQQSFYIYERNMAFLTGIGIEWRIFGLRRKSYIAPDTSYFHGYIDTTSGFTLKKNNLRNFNLQIPLLFDFRFGKKNRFSFMTGVVGTWMLLSSQKMELTNNGYEYEIVKKDQFNLNPFQLKAHASVGYKDVHFFGEYAFNGMFLKNRGPAFRFLTVGLRYSFNYD